MDIFVTCNGDFFNSADESHFFLNKGEIRRLPEKLTIILEKALEDGLLRKATDKEIKEFVERT